MIRFYFDQMPNSAKVRLFLEEADLPYEAIAVDTRRGEPREPSFLAINPTGKAPAIVDTDGPGGREARVFGATAILIYLAETTGMFMGEPDDRPELLSWLFHLAYLGTSAGKAPRFQFAAPVALDYALDRGWREAERDYQLINSRLEGRKFIVGETYTIVDMTAWCLLNPALRETNGAGGPLDQFPNLKRLFEGVDSRPAAVRTREVGADHSSERVTGVPANRSSI